MPDQLEDPQDPHDPDLEVKTVTIPSSLPHQADDLSRLADDLEVLQPLQYQGDVEGTDGHNVDNVHRLSHEPSQQLALFCSSLLLPSFVRADDESYEHLDREEDDHKVVNHLDDEDDDGILDVTRLVLKVT